MSAPTITEPVLPVPPSIPFLDLRAMTEEVREGVDATWREVTEGSQFVGGSILERFEHEWATYCERPHAVGVANGTDALQLALEGLGIGEGAEVLVPANTFVATVEAVVAVGAVPRFVDVDDDTLLVTAGAIDEAVTPRTEAVIVVHLYGQPADMDAIGAVAAKHHLAVVEDAAQAHGGRWQGRRVGSMSDAACFSFYPGKNLGAFGDGGAVVTGDAGLAERIRSLGDHGRAIGGKYVHPLVGRNSRLDALQAGVLGAKLGMLDRWNEQRRLVADLYREGLAGTGARVVAEAPGAWGVHHLFVVRLSHRDEVQAALAARRIGTGIHYPIPCHHQEAFRSFHADGPVPVTEAAAGQILSLPMYPHLQAGDVTVICEALAEVAPPHEDLMTVGSDA